MQKHIRNYLKSLNLKTTETIMCELCGSNQSINIHHIQHRQKNNPALDEANNLIALCQDGCHAWIHANNSFENKEKLQEIINKRLN